MAGEPHTNPGETLPHDLQLQLERFQQIHPRDLAFLDLNFDLRELALAARSAGESGKIAVREILKRVLLICPPWSRSAEYVAGHLADLVYAPREGVAIEQAELHAQQRMSIIESEIAAGKDPWLAHADHNERDLLNPLIVGVYQDETGKARTIYGPKQFRSKRQIESSFLAGRSEYKEVNLVAGSFLPVQPTKVLKSEYWDLLPTDLRSHLEAGEILVTGGPDLYALTDSEISAVATSDDPAAYLNLIDAKSARASSEGSPYHLLYYSDYASDETGRTGVVMRSEAGRIEPLVVRIQDREFALEVKGCGKKSGGFGPMQARTGRNIVTGGAEAAQAETEFYRLQDDERADTPKAVGAVLFRSPDHREYDQGYVLRLTPSTVRAAYTGIEAYPNIESPELVNRIITIYASQLADHIFRHPHKLLDRSSHSENMLLWGNGSFAWTDYSDHAVFADPKIPHYDNHGGYMTARAMLEYYIEMVREIPGYRAERDGEIFHTALRTAFGRYGEALQLNPSDKYQTVTQELWQHGVAYQVFRAKHAQGYFPESVVRSFIENINESYNRQRFGFESEEAFVARVAQGRTDLLQVIEMVQRVLESETSGEWLKEWKTAVKDGALSTILSGLQSFRALYGPKYEALDEESRSALASVMGYFNMFDGVFVEELREYFQQELDVVSTAKLRHRPESDVLEQAEQELRGRIKKIQQLVDTDLRGFYRLCHSPEQVAELLSFDFYGQSVE